MSDPLRTSHYNTQNCTHCANSPTLTAACAAGVCAMELEDLREQVAALRAENERLRAALTPTSEIPEPKVGDVWASPRPRVEPRTVVRIGPKQAYPWAGDKCVFFESKSRPQHPQWGPAALPPERWRAWALKSGARPIVALRDSA